MASFAALAKEAAKETSVIDLRPHVASGSVHGVRIIVEAHGTKILETAYDAKNPRMIFKVVREGHVALLRVMVEEWLGCWEVGAGWKS